MIAKINMGPESNSNVNDINFNLQMINTYKDFIRSDSVLDDTGRILKEVNNYEVTSQELKNMVSVEQTANSQMFTIKAVSQDATLSQAVAGALGQVFQEQVVSVLNIDKVTILSGAALNESPVSPNVKLNLLIGSVLGIMLGIALAFLLEVMDKTVKSEKEITEIFELPIMGIIPHLPKKAENIATQKELLHDQRKGSESYSRPTELPTSRNSSDDRVVRRRKRNRV
ncbi:hypothetical protein CBF29_01430 [Vagococcus elongatus]|uniref:Tyrosine-protein kinase G-rich domain-containing protein n=2 Tax=Vagococcus elongatus TaxID=180344 RepID=A0A430B402_9ENTE|nr:hypothetical protein CBF29_01430 [Vagococcus elongatus]